MPYIDGDFGFFSAEAVRRATYTDNEYDVTEIRDAIRKASYKGIPYTHLLHYDARHNKNYIIPEFILKCLEDLGYKISIISANKYNQDEIFYDKYYEISWR